MKNEAQSITPSVQLPSQTPTPVTPTTNQLKMLIYSLRPKNTIELIGILLLFWMLSVFLVPSWNNPKYLLIKIAYDTFTLPVRLATKFPIPIPQNAELGAIAFLLFNLILIVAIINLLTIIIYRLVTHSFSFTIIKWSILMILTTIIITFVRSKINSINYQKEYTENSQTADLINIAVSDCLQTTSLLKNMYGIKCTVTLSNLPQDVNDLETTYEFKFGSAEYSQYSEKELQKKLSKGGTDKEYLINVFNHQLPSVEQLKDPQILNTNSVTGTILVNIDSNNNINPKSVYLQSFSFWRGFDTYSSSIDRKIYLQPIVENSTPTPPMDSIQAQKCFNDKDCQSNTFCDYSNPGGIGPNGFVSGQPYGSQKCILKCQDDNQCSNGQCQTFEIVIGDIVINQKGCVSQNDQILGIQINACCSCPIKVRKSLINIDGWVIYEKDKDYSSLRPTDYCKKTVCTPCPPLE